MKEHNNSNLHEEIKSNGKGEYPRNICLHKNLYRPLDLGIIEMKVWKAETVDLHHLRRFYYHLNLRISAQMRGKVLEWALGVSAFPEKKSGGL
ncbi:uncharacterized protein LOC144293718 isoform X4 [Canis aureus]